jgi:hypothetical protein
MVLHEIEQAFSNANRSGTAYMILDTVRPDTFL